MSIKLMSQVWDKGPTRTTDKMVLLVLADCTNDQGDGTCWPGMDTIAARACLTNEGTRGVLKRLQDDGWITKTEQGGGRRSNTYRIEVARFDPPTTLGGQLDDETPTTLGAPPNPVGGTPQEPVGGNPNRTGIEPENTPPPAGAVVEVVSVGPPKNAATLIGRWYDGHRARGNPDPPEPFMRRVRGQAKRCADDCKTDDDWRAAWHAAYAAGERGHVDIVRAMVAARPLFSTERTSHDVAYMTAARQAPLPGTIAQAIDAAFTTGESHAKP